MKERDVHRAFGVAGAAVALVGVAWGLSRIDSPAEARLRRLDEARSRSLGVLDRALRAHADEEGALPPSLDALEGVAEDDRSDPVTGAPYGYRRLAADRFELCADFATEIEAAGARPVAARPRYGEHGAGRRCFATRVQPDEAPPRPAP